MQKKNLLLVIILLFTFSCSAQDFYESFDGCSGVGGNDGFWNHQTSGSIVADNIGWKFDGASAQANQCVCLGSSNVQGFAMTPALGIEGDATLTFKAGPWTGYNQELAITISSGSGTVLTKRVTMIEGTFTDYSIDIQGLSSTSKIKIASTTNTKSRFFLDEVKIVPVEAQAEEIILSGESQTDDNATVISQNFGKTVDVKLNRRLVNDGCWYTLCLPFAIMAEDIENTLGGAKIEMMTNVASSEATDEFIFKEVTNVEAGVPFIILPTKDINNVVFKSKTIVVENAGIESIDNAYGTFSFKGTFSPVTIASDGTELFLSSDGRTLTKPKGDSKLKALRAYFIVPIDRNNVTISTTNSTGIQTVDYIENDNSLPVYDLLGRRILDSKNHGIYIVNGKKRIR